jgi:glycosyltransferase involved in cell wall biosynthesis
MTGRAHLVYAVPQRPDRFLVERAWRRGRSMLNDLGMPVGLIGSREPTTEELDSWPARSPYTITKYLYRALARRLPTRLYHLQEHVRCGFQKDDIFIGHPYFPHANGRLGVTELAAASTVRPKRFALITPLHCDTSVQTTHLNGAFLHDVNSLVSGADVVFGIMGKYWWDRWDTSEFRHWKPKMVRLDMAIDASGYPHLKKTFNDAGTRRCFMIASSDEPLKGGTLFAQIASACPDIEFGWIGDGPEIPGARRISHNRPLTAEFMRGVAARYDIFLSCSRADANPTTILEAMAWGFPVLSTLESGYYAAPYRRTVPFRDTTGFVAAVKQLQQMSSEDLRAMSDAARAVVVRDFTWDRFTGDVMRRLTL